MISANFLINEYDDLFSVLFFSMFFHLTTLGLIPLLGGSPSEKSEKVISIVLDVTVDFAEDYEEKGFYFLLT